MKDIIHKRKRCGGEKSTEPWVWKWRDVIYSFFELILYYSSNNIAKLFWKVNEKRTYS